MNVAAWSAIVGFALIVLALSDSILARLPLSTAMLYLLAGAATSPLWLDWTSLAIDVDAANVELMAEVVVVISLFTAGLKMSVGLADGRWLLPLRLAVASMLVTAALVAVCGVWWLGLPLGAAILLGGILAPTDPVLASAVRLTHPGDRDRLRFSLTGEGGLNDGTAFPVVFLGLGLLGLHEIGDYGWRWLAVDVVWGVAAGIAIGAGLGTLVGWLVLYLRRTRKEAVGLDNFLALGLIGLSYGLASLAHGLGFLAVFSAGVALRRLEQQASAESLGSETASPVAVAAAGAAIAASARIAEAALADPDVSHAERVATDPRHAPAYMAHALLSFNEQIDRIGEVAAVVAIGALLWTVDWTLVSWGFVAVVLLVIRPLSVAAGLAGSRTSRRQRLLIGWFGIRGVGSLYYLMYAANHGLPPRFIASLAALTLAVVVVSIVAHGISVTPLMELYRRRRRTARGVSEG